MLFNGGFSLVRGFLRLTRSHITVRVQSMGLIADDSDNPRAVLFIHLWTNFNRLVSQPIEYTSSRLKLSVWTANNARRLREEMDHAAESLAAQIMGILFPAT